MIGLFFILFSTSFTQDLGNGYRYDYYHGGDFDYITKNDKMFIKNSVLDIDVFNEYVVGIQLPRCTNTHEQKIMLSTIKTYFILNTKNNTVSFYTSKSKFIRVITKLGLHSKLDLKYDKFKNMIKYTLKRYESSALNGHLERCNNNNNQLYHEPLKIEWRMGF